MDPEVPVKNSNFIYNKIDEDLKNNKNNGRLQTRFPPEPNGYLHIGHAKAICLNFGIPLQYPAAKCNLRFDDTNPEKESTEYVDAIKADVSWLGYKWAEETKFASDYFEKLYEYAVALIKLGKAYVCELDAEKMREYRGTLTQPGKESPFRDRSVEENLKIFAEMKAGAFPDGSRVLRAKIDMSSGNINMRDPVVYRIRRAHHHRSGDKWCIYPMYDFTHCLSDALEGITHSLCTLEFQDHRPLYDWYIDTLKTEFKPEQTEFARLNLSYTITSKRKLKALVDEARVSGWDDPRLPTLKGMRRRGYTPASIRSFCDRMGVSKKETTIDMSILEDCLRNDLNSVALRRFAVLDPIKVTISNYEQGPQVLTVPNHPQQPEMGSRDMLFAKELYIDREDFMEDAPKKFFRLKPGGEVRLRYAYIVRCEEVIKDDSGKVIELICSYDPDTLGKKPEDRKVKGIIHWLAKGNEKPTEIHLYDRLFCSENPQAVEDYHTELNPNSLQKVFGLVEASVTTDPAETAYQFERLGYFTKDQDSTQENLRFNRSVSLRDSWKK